jgi:hypothetical protein
MNIRISSAILLVAGICIGAHAQESQLNIPRLGYVPAIEDFLLGPPVNGMTQVSNFIQNLPHDGEPASQETLAYLGYDSQNLYVVFLAYDDPGQVRARMSPRENISQDDRVSVLLDPFRDQRRGYMFQANPLGVQLDRFFVEDQGFDASYDTVWTSKGAVTDWGYVVLMALPFKSLRFSPDADTPWGLILMGTIQRQNETSTWPPVSTRIEGILNQAALVKGIQDVSPGKNLQIIPYATTRWIDGIEAGNEPVFNDDSFDIEVGVDVKKVWNDSIVTDVTINPDFAQIESDEPQVTVNQRFEVFFPERRPFFLENADMFRSPINLFFTRRIVDPQIGGRLTGKLGPWAIGSLLIDDDAPGDWAPRNHPDHGENTTFGTVRVSRDLGKQSRLSAMAVQRDFADDSNRVLSVDGRLKWNEHWVSSAQAAVSSTEIPNAEDDSGQATYISTSRSGRHFNYSGTLSDISEDFDAEAGFVPRKGIVNTDHFASYFFWQEEGGNLIHWGPEIGANIVWDRHGQRLDEMINASLEWEFLGRTELEINVNHGRVRLTPEEFPVLDNARDYDADFISIGYQSAMWKTVSFEGETKIGKRINLQPLPGLEPEPVDWLQSDLSISYRPVTQLAIDTTLIYTHLENESGGARVLEDLIARVRVNWQFTREWSLRTIIQYERTDPNPLETTVIDRDNWNIDLLLTYRVNPWTAVYFSYNNNRQNVDTGQQEGIARIIPTSDLQTDREQLLFKFSYLIRR